jgi:hypothetical protein
MSNFKPLNPSHIDESLIKVIEFEGRHHVLLPFVDATGSVPEYRSVGHALSQGAVRVQDLDALTGVMLERARGTAVWYILFSTPWLLSLSHSDAIQKVKAARR